MPHHDWGDEDFDFQELYKAMAWVGMFYRRTRKQSITCKEKYGTVRYEFTWMWCKTRQDALILSEILRRACYKFPSMAAELVDDWFIGLPYPRFLQDMYYYAFFEGVIYGTTHSGWWPKKRPYKPHKKDNHSKYRKDGISE